MRLLGVVVVALFGAACSEEFALRDEVVHVPLTTTWSRALNAGGPPILFLNRCPNGCTVRPGDIDDSRYDISTVLSSTVNFPPYPHGDDEWERTVRCVQEMFAKFEIVVTDVDPGLEPHFENILSGTPRLAGFGPEVGGVGSFSCNGVIPNAMSFSFAETIPEYKAACVVASHEAGHNFGLQHELMCNDPMTYLRECGDKHWQRADVQCGEYDPRPCECGIPFQNTYLSLLESFGPRRTPISYEPYVEIKDPAHDGDRVEPRFLVFAEAKDDVRITRVDLFVDGVEAGSSTLAPYLYRVRDGLAEGEHVLMARAYDSDGLVDTATRTVNLVIPPMMPRRDSGVEIVDAIDAPPDAGFRDANALPDAEDAPLDTGGGCACSGSRERDRASVAWLFLLALPVLLRRRSAAVAAVALMSCTGGDDLSFVGAELELTPPPGTPLLFEEVVLGRSGPKPEPILVHAKSVGPGSVRLDPPPVIEGPGADQFFVSSAPRVLAPSQEGDIYVRFQPTITGTTTAELVIRSNDRDLREARYPLAGPAREACVLSMFPTHQRIEVGETKSITIRAVSTRACIITNMRVDQLLFEFVDPPPLPVKIPAGELLNIRVKHRQRTVQPGVPVRHVIVDESEGTEAFASLEGQPAAFNCIGAFPDKLELPTGALGVPTRGRVLVTNRCDTRVHILAAYITIGIGIYSIAPHQVPFGVDPFGFAGLYVTYEPFTDLEDLGVLVMQTDDALVPRIEIALTGKGILPRAYALRTADFGAVAYPGCAATEKIPIFSGGTAELVVKDVAIDPAGDPGFTILGGERDGVAVDLAQPVGLLPGSKLEVNVAFAPVRATPAEHESRLSFTHTAIPPITEVVLSGRAAAPGAVLDQFTAGPPRVDVMFVIDDSLSMAAPIAQLEAHAAGFLDLASSRSADYQIGVTNADAATRNSGWLRRCFVRGGWVSPTTSDQVNDLECRLHVGTRGRQLQSAIAAAMRAVDHAVEPTPSGFEPNINHGFVRDGAKLAIVMVSNDDDQSEETITTARDYLVAVKGRRDLVEVHAIAGPIANACVGGAPWTVPGHRYKALADLTGGTYWDVCAADLGPPLDGIADVAFRANATFPLSRKADPTTIRVEVDGTAVLEDVTSGFSYDAIDNTVTLHGASAPANGAQIAVSYNASCTR